MTGNPYASRLTIAAWTGFIVGVVLAIISATIDPVSSSLFYGPSINETEAWWKASTGVLADVSIAIGIAATIGWTILAGVEWRIGQSVQSRTFESVAEGSTAAAAGPRTLEEAQAEQEQ